MALQGGDDVGDGHLATVMEGNVAADLEGPDGGVGGRLPRGGECRQRSAGLRVRLDEGVAPEAADDEEDRGAVACGVEHVTRRAALEAKLEMAAALGFLRPRGLGKKAAAEGSEAAKGCRAAEETAAADVRGQNEAVGISGEVGHGRFPFLFQIRG